LIDEVGGGERLMLHLVEALRSLGHSVDVYAQRVEPAVAAMLGLNTSYVKLMRCSRFYSALEGVLGASGRFVRMRRLLLLLGCLDEVAELRDSYDLVFETRTNALLPVDVVYIHFPAKFESELQRSGIHWRLYNLAVKCLVDRLEGRGMPRLVLTNSTWTKERILEAYGSVLVEVLHPPVRVEFFGEVWGTPFSERERLIVTVSRFTPEKNLHEIPRLAKALQDYEFVIAGATSKYSGAVVRRIADEVDRLGVKNVRLVLNPTSWEIRELLGRARFYLHPPFAEHFGIAIAEGIAAGAIPVVYRDGGGWTDIVSRISSELGYSRIEEATKIIRSVEADPDRAEKLRQRGREVVGEFSFENFRKGLADVVERLSREPRR